MSCYHDAIPAEIKTEIYSSFYVADGTSRQTRSLRFTDLDPIALKFIKHEAPPGPLHDIAVADGSTSLRFLELLRKQGINRQFYISDKYARLTIERGVPERITDQNGDLLAVYPGCLIADKSPIMFIGSRLLFNLYQKMQTQRSNGDSITLRLWAPRVEQALSCVDLHELSYDVFSPPSRRDFSFIRCMNILHSGYFSDRRITVALQNIADSLIDGGILLIGRTMRSGTNNATFFKKSGSHFSVLRTVNDGYERSVLIV